MKIIYLHQYFKKPNENGGTRSFDLSKYFVSNGINVEMITTTSNFQGFENNNKWKVENVEGINVHYLFLPYDNSFSFFKRILVFFQFLYFSTFRILKIDADLVLSTSTPLTIGIPALIKKYFSKTPFVFEVRDVWPEAVIAIGEIKNKFVIKLLNWLEYYLYKESKFIVPLSEDMKASILRRYPKFEDKIPFVIENISEIKRFTVPDSSKKDSWFLENIGKIPNASILYGGTFGKVNNIEYVLELAYKIKELNKNIIFILMGSGSLKKSLIQKAKDLKVLNDNVFFINPVQKDELPLIYSYHTAGSSFVAPIKQLWANSANKFFDTLAAGKPIIINHGGWQAKVIEEHQNGYVLNGDISLVDIKDFSEYLLDKDRLEKSGKSSKFLAHNRYSLEIAADKYIKIFNNF